MVRLVTWGLLVLSFSSLSAMLVGNPAQPALLEKSVFRMTPRWCSFRIGYLSDWVYHQRFRDEFKQEGTTHTRTFMKLSTYSSLLTFNFVKRIDLYGLVGSSRMQIDKEIFTKRALGWGIGTKAILIKRGNFFLGTDLKYFETNQKPRYIVIEGHPYNIVSKFRLRYQEYQVALGASYRAWIFAPYAEATYLMTWIDPEPVGGFLVRLPDMDEIVDVPTKSVVSKKHWGMALGLTMIDCSTMTLSVEWRAFNQNAVDWNFEIRF